MAGWKPSLANSLTLIRLLLSPLLALLLVEQRSRPALGWLALGVFAAGALSDLLDGRVARRLGTDCLRGKQLDAIADIGFLLPSLVVLACQERLPLLLPLAVSAAFVPFALNLFCFPERAFDRRSVADGIGHLGGIGNWLVLGIATVALGPLGHAGLESSVYLSGIVAAVLNFSAAALHLHAASKSTRRLPEDAF